MFATFSRSWEFAKMSYRMLAVHKRLILFPVFSTIAAILVIASFILPLWQSGQLMTWLEITSDGSTTEISAGASNSSEEVMMWVTLFLFYFCNYFVIVFFNTGLIACVLKIMHGEEAPVSYGFSFAFRRLPQIVGWALLSAVVGVLLRAIEKAHEKAGDIVAALLGSAWTALTYFVVPIIVVESANPAKALKRSTEILRSTWGEALVGNFSLGFFSFLATLPSLLIGGGLIWFAMQSDSFIGMGAAIGIAVALLMVSAAISTAADSVFKGYLYAYATGRSLPEDVDETQFRQAFRPKK
jgi:hypothetical protein